MQVITDLLNPEATHLLIREDIKRGVFVERLSEHVARDSACLPLMCGLLGPCGRPPKTVPIVRA